MNNRHSKKTFPYRMTSLFAIALLILITGGIWFYNVQKQDYRQSAFNELSSIAQLKANQIADWRKDQIEDAVLLVQTPLFYKDAVRLLSNSKAKASDNFRNLLVLFGKNNDIAEIKLVDLNGRIRLSLSEHDEEMQNRYGASLATALRERKPVFTELHTDARNPKPHIKVIAPIFTGGRNNQPPIGAIFFISNISDLFYPLIQSWPTPSESAETLLVRRDGGDILFLSSSRHQTDTALKKRIPLNKINSIEVMAVLGKKGFLEGKDYREVDVVALGIPIPDSTWVLVAKEDASEIYSSWLFRSRLILALIMVMGGALIATGLVVWQRNQKAHYRMLYRSETALRESEKTLTMMAKEWKRTFDTMNDAVWITDKELRVLQTNTATEKFFHRPSSEIVGRHCWEIAHDREQPIPECPILVSRESLTRETTELLLSDKWFEVTVDPLLDEDGHFAGSIHVIREITERKQVETAQNEQVMLNQLGLEVSRSLTHTETLPAALQECCEAMVRNLDAAFARIWTLKEGSAVLELQASAGIYTHIDGPHRYVPVGQYKIGLIAAEKKPHLTNSVIGDPRIHNQEWAKREGMVAFAGHPLMVQNQVVGVMAMFARHPFSDMTLKALNSIANEIAFATYRKQAEEALLRAEENFRRSIDESPMGVRIISADSETIYANRSILDMYGYSLEELKKTHASERYSPKSYAEYLDRREKRLRGEETPSEYEIEIVRKDGGIRTLQVFRKEIIWDGERQFQILYRDITDHKLTEEALRESERRYRILFDRAIDGIFILSKDGKLVDINESFARMHGYSTQEMVQMNLKDLDTPETYQQTHERIRRLLEGETLTFEVQHIHKNGHIFPLEVSASMLKIAGESFIQCYHRDITERKQAEEEKQKLEVQLRQAQKMEAIGRLAGGVAHDFNNMLNVIIGYGEIVLNKLHHEDSLREKVEEIIKAGKRSAGLTSQLLAFSRKQPLQPEVLDLNALLKNLEKMLRRLISENIELVLALAENLVRIKADTAQIEQVIMNLAVNARDAMPHGGTLTIETANVEFDHLFAQNVDIVVPGKYAMIAITDTGHGMDKETASKVFEPFFTTKELGKGIGLGLATVYGIVKQSGGNIWVYSEKEKGTIFKIYLPCTDAEPEVELEVKEIKPLEIKRGGDGRHVLVVDDEESLRDLFYTFLTELGYKVTVAANGAEALLLIEEKGLKPDLIITDVVMPGMSGASLVERLLMIQPDLKVLYMSGYTDNIIVHHGVVDPEIPFIQKPFNIKDIAAKIEQVIQGIKAKPSG